MQFSFTTILAVLAMATISEAQSAKAHSLEQGRSPNAVLGGPLARDKRLSAMHTYLAPASFELAAILNRGCGAL
ncbi:hypothetical protein E0Z10_g10410 [Xylaria hypoxylon]|uniref:Uncharacterized protein n=1 Tax=Xylaria hypoxylon TaxID=37992 RepID=A0A4Z0YGG0_9PEZI|nr:hypothetical protein E0Z10_g10410 [Xylaria hypoxylon]